MGILLKREDNKVQENRVDCGTRSAINTNHTEMGLADYYCFSSLSSPLALQKHDDMLYKGVASSLDNN